MDAMECIMNRRSCRAFKPDMPDMETVKKIVNAGRHAPNGMSRQTWHFAVISNPDWLRRMNERVIELVNPASKSSNLERNGALGYSCNYHSPILVVVSADPQFGTSSGDCGCALENMFLAATALGLGSCWINQLGGENCEPLRDLLTEAGVPTENVVYGCCALGYEAAPPAPRKPRKECVSFY